MLPAFHVAYRPDEPPGGAAAPDPAAAAPAATAPPAMPPGGAPVDLAAENQQLKADLAATRREAAGYRTGNKGQLAEAAKAFAALAGVSLADDKAPPDLAGLAATLEERFKTQDAEMRRLKIDNALGEIYTKHAVVPELARAVLESKGVLSALDPSDGEFSKTLNGAVKKLAEDYPQLKVTQTAPTPTRSGVEFPGNNGALPQLTREEIAKMPPEAVIEARKKGQLNQLMGRGES